MLWEIYAAQGCHLHIETIKKVSKIGVEKRGGINGFGLI